MKQPQIQVKSADESYCFAIWNDVLCTVWRDMLTVERLRELEIIFQELGERGKYSIVHQVAVIRKLPSSEARDAAVESRKKFADYIDNEACIIVGEGFWVSAIRSVNTAILTLAVPPYPSQVFSTPEDAVRWQWPLLRAPTFSKADYLTGLKWIAGCTDKSSTPPF